ncbi:MAG TPA: hypothetical protein PKE12_02290 [Kiritimatiellia bacterium]|nr:hypothetical protein [Kiritimatiellia bacterium]
MNLFPLIAAKLQRDPSLLHEALNTAHRWIEDQRAPVHRVETWRDLILNAMTSKAAFEQLLNLLRDESEEARRLKDFAPFAGLLTREERREVILSCGYDH